MSVQRLGPRWLRRLSAAVGEPVKLGWGHGGYVHSFVTETHRHGNYDTKTGEITWPVDQDAEHLSSCYGEEWPEELRARHPEVQVWTCGRCPFEHRYWPTGTSTSVRLLGRAIREHYEIEHPDVEVGH